MQRGLEGIVARLGISALSPPRFRLSVLDFMDHLPTDWHFIWPATTILRSMRICAGSLSSAVSHMFPLATKQCSISYAHQQKHIDFTLEQIEAVLSRIGSKAKVCPGASSKDLRCRGPDFLLADVSPVCRRDHEESNLAEEVFREVKDDRSREAQ